jgi:hypothetical protein
MPVLIHGQLYSTVAERIAEIQTEGKLKSVETQITSSDSSYIIVKAIITTDKGVFTGHAEEKRGAIGIGGESPVEVAETSAVGRALAFAGYLGNVKVKSIASADEITAKTNKLPQEEPKPATADTVKQIFNGEEVLVCQGCAEIISDYQGFKASQIANFSQKKYGKALCIKCQKEQAPKKSKK